jgi:hypothetical protein
MVALNDSGWAPVWENFSAHSLRVFTLSAFVGKFVSGVEPLSISLSIGAQAP